MNDVSQLTSLDMTVVVRVSLTLNVRTALFTQSDLSKKDWSQRDIALLKARMFLQDLIPPMEVSRSPEYVSSLLRYIRDCYASLNREASDGETQTVLNDALSDVIGGYLKMVALPVTKSLYYSGCLPTRDALQIFKYYDDIKHQLHTRGTGWGNQVTTNIRTKNMRGARSDYEAIKVKDPCKRLLYLQNNQQNLSMPMPAIDWGTGVMFVPLKDEPIVQLRARHTGPVLQKFHRVATACERSAMPEQKHFQDSFEGWVNHEVIPHLSDDDLYTAFKGILSIIDASNVPDCTETKNLSCVKCFSMSTNTMIIIGILILEFVCCVPTLLYLLKKKKAKCKSASTLGSSPNTCSCPTKSSKVLFLDKTIYKLSSHSTPCQSQIREAPVDIVNYKKYSGIFDKNNSDMSSISGTRRSYSSITDPTVLEEVPLTRKYSKRDKNVQPSGSHLYHYQQTETDKTDITQHTQVSTLSLGPKATSTSTTINFDETAREFNETVQAVTVSTNERDSATKMLRKSRRFRRRAGSPVKRDSSLIYSEFVPPISNLRERHSSRISNTAEELKMEIYGNRMWEKSLTGIRTEKRVEFASPQVSQADGASVKLSELSGSHSQPSRTTLSRRGSLRVMNVFDEDADQNEDQEHSAFEVTLDARHACTLKAEECAEVSKSWKGILKGTDEKQGVKRTSKIPKRIGITNAPCESYRPVRPVTELVHSSPRHKSLIPTLKRALDDSAILSSSPRETKFNITL